MRILVIEDCREEQSLVAVALDGFELRFVESYAEGIRELERQIIDVILADLNTREDWRTEGLKKLLKVTNIPIVVWSGVHEHQLAKECIKLGAKDFLVKQYTDKDLIIKTLRKACER